MIHGQLTELRERSTAMVGVAKRLSQMETSLSNQIVTEARQSLLPSQDGPLAPPMSPESWQLVMRAAGLGSEVEQQIPDVSHLLHFTPNWSSMTVLDRLDVRYLRDMMKHRSLSFLHPFHQRYESNRKIHTGRKDSTHSCVACDCGDSVQFVNLVKEQKSPLARLDWMKTNINGPRAIMMKGEDLQQVFGLSEAEALPYLGPLAVLRKNHKRALFEEED